jgi:hypothetical protein
MKKLAGTVAEALNADRGDSAAQLYPCAKIPVATTQDRSKMPDVAHSGKVNRGKRRVEGDITPPYQQQGPCWSFQDLRRLATFCGLFRLFPAIRDNHSCKGEQLPETDGS